MNFSSPWKKPPKPENERRTWSAIERRLPGVSVSQDCPLDRALELWFAAPDELTQFEAPRQPVAPTTAESESISASPPCPSAVPLAHPIPLAHPMGEGSRVRAAGSGEGSGVRALPQSQIENHLSSVGSAKEEKSQIEVIYPLAFAIDNSELRTPNCELGPSPLQHSNTPSLPSPPVPSPSDDEAAFLRLAALTPAQYDRVRQSEATRLGIRLETLDSEVAHYRYEAEARDFKLPVLEPWPEPVDGAQVLHQVADRFILRLLLPPGAPQAITLWNAHAHAPRAFLHTPRLNLTSAEPVCGKTTTVDLIAALTPRAIRTENIKVAVLFRLVDKHQPTLLLDEVDSFLLYTEELRGLINAGHKQGACAYRCEGNHVRAFNAFGPAVISGIGPVPDTLRSRSIRIELFKAEEGKAPRFDSRQIEIEKVLNRKLARWASDNFAALQACDPPMPPSAYNRVADNWRPLFAIAHVAGGDWPALALEAYNHLAIQGPPKRPTIQSSEFKVQSSKFGPGAESQVENQKSKIDPAPHSALRTPNSELTTGAPCDIQLLKAIQLVFAQTGQSRLTSKQLVELLLALPEALWQSKFKTHKSKMSALAHCLHRFGVWPRAMRINGRCVKGYDIRDFTTALPNNASDPAKQP